MEIHFTEQAMTRLANQLDIQSEYLCLIYEVGGCGNPLDGTLRMQATATRPSNTVSLLTNWIPIYMDAPTIKFVDDCLTIDYKPNGYIIKSNSQIYSYFLSLEKERS